MKKTTIEAISKRWITTDIGSAEPFSKLLTIAIDIVAIKSALPIFNAYFAANLI